MRQALIILLVILLLGAWGARNPARALHQAQINLIAYTLGEMAFSAAAYYVWKNSPAQRAKGYEESLGLGDWYVSGYAGLSYLPSADWQFFQGFTPPYQGHTAKNVVYQPGVQAGIKLGRYFDSLPCFGLEMETSFSHNQIRPSQGLISPPIPNGPTNLIQGADRFYIWALQINLLARYGFLKDKEVPFGRLQPYVGIGPGFEIMYGVTDSAKNFAIETQGGIRYMFTQNLAVFCEYKFSYQFGVEYEQVLVAKQHPEGMMRFDVPHHRFILGVSYHFKNLYGN